MKNRNMRQKITIAFGAVVICFFVTVGALFYGMVNISTRYTQFYKNNHEAIVHPHAFRHLFAKNFIEKCDDIALLSDILGHESIETTRIYLHKSSTEQQNLFNQIVNW